MKHGVWLSLIAVLALVSCKESDENPLDFSRWFKEDKKLMPAPALPVANLPANLPKDKQFTIAKYYIEQDKLRRWSGFRMMMNLAYQNYLPAKEYYSSVRETAPVLPGDSIATFAVYAGAAKPMLAKAITAMKTEKRKSCTEQDAFTLLNTQQVDDEGTERWLFSFCGSKITLPIVVKLNQQTGFLGFTLPENGVVFQ